MQRLVESCIACFAGLLGQGLLVMVFVSTDVFLCLKWESLCSEASKLLETLLFYGNAELLQSMA
jgi:hypothetical protein